MVLVASLLITFGGQDAETRRILDLIEQLGSDGVEQRQRAALALKAAPDAALPELRKAARDRGGEISARARDLIRWIEVQKLLTPGLKKHLPDLEKELLEGQAGAWSSAFNALQFDDDLQHELTERERGLIYALALEEAESNEERKEILLEAFHRPGPMKADGVIALLSSPDIEVRAAAARALGAVGGAGAVAPLRKALADPEADVLGHAIEALGRLRARDAAPDLKRLLSHPGPGIAAEAALALGRMGAREADADLRALLRHENAAIRSSAAYALSDLGMEDGPQLLGNVLRSEEFAIQEEAADRLRALGPRAIPALRDVLKDRSAVARRLAATALGKMRAAEAASDLQALLADPEKRVRESAVEALEDLNPEGLPKALIPLLQDPAWEVRHSAARALGTLNAKESADGLHARLVDPAPYVGIAAAASLARLGDDRGVPLLLREAKDRHMLVQQVIPLTSLNVLREPAAWERLRSFPMEAPIEGRTRRVLQRLCEVAGLKLDLSDDDSDMDESDDPWMERRLRSRPGTTALRVIEGLRGNGAYDFIVEPGVLRVLPHSEAIRFWSDWWEKRRKK